MTNHICDACETVSHCHAKGCIPLTPLPFRPAPCKGSGETLTDKQIDRAVNAWFDTNDTCEEIHFRERMRAAIAATGETHA